MLFVIDINGTEVCVLDAVGTPYSDVLRAAADILEREGDGRTSSLSGKPHYIGAC